MQRSRFVLLTVIGVAFAVVAAASKGAEMKAVQVQVTTERVGEIRLGSGWFARCSYSTVATPAGEACTSWTLSWPDKQSDAYLKLLTESSADWVTVDLYYGYFAFRTFATVAEYRSPVFVALKKS